MKKSIVLNDTLDREKNNFDLIRLILAVMVIFGHSFYLMPNGGWQDPGTILLKVNFLGSLAVGSFFFLSGIFISQSYVTYNSPLKFILLRIARLYPGLLVCLITSAFLLGPIVTDVSIKNYFSDVGPYCYLMKNWGILPLYSPAYCPDLSAIYLPGVFQNNFYVKAVNGSLWTLTPEIICYGYLLIFGLIGVLYKPRLIILCVLLLVVLHNFHPALFYYFSDLNSDKLKIALSFLAGVLAFATKDRLTISFSYLLILLSLLFLSWFSSMKEWIFYIFIFYLILVAGANPTIRKIRLNGDYSYGVYIYGFPVQQAFNHFYPQIESYPSMFITIPLSLIMGYISWNLIEKPSLLAIKGRIKALTRAKAPTYIEGRYD